MIEIRVYIRGYNLPQGGCLFHPRAAVSLDKNRKASPWPPSYRVALCLTLNLELGFYSAWFPSHWLRRPRPPSCQVNRARNLQSIRQEFRSQLRERLLGTRSWNRARNLRIRDVFPTRRISRAGSKDGSWWSLDSVALYNAYHPFSLDEWVDSSYTERKVFKMSTLRYEHKAIVHNRFDMILTCEIKLIKGLLCNECLTRVTHKNYKQRTRRVLDSFINDSTIKFISVR